MINKLLKPIYHYYLISKSGFFDRKYYLENYPDVRKADMDPLWHFVKFGWLEGRNPSPTFETVFYLNKYDDVRKSEINPLVHYLLYGKREERVTNQEIIKIHPLEKINNNNIINTTISPLDQLKTNNANHDLIFSLLKNKRRKTQDRSKPEREFITEIKLASIRKKISFISQPEYFNFTYKNALDDIYDVKEFIFNYSMNYEDFKDLLDFDADYNIFFRGEHMPNQVLKKLNGKTINLSSEPFPREIKGKIEYSYDSMVRYRSFRSIRNKSFDYIFHYDEASLELMEKDGLFLSGQFAFPVATSVYHPEKSTKEWDLFFIGRSTYHRESFFADLKHYHKFLHIAHGIWGEGLVKYINKSKICLNVHAENEISWEPRLQMLLACKAFVISEPITPNEYLRPGIDFVEVRNKQELTEAVNYYLMDEEQREKIAENGYHRILEKLDSKKVFINLIHDIENDHYPKFRARSGRFFWELFDFLWKSWQSTKRLFKHG